MHTIVPQHSNIKNKSNKISSTILNTYKDPLLNPAETSLQIETLDNNKTHHAIQNNLRILIV